MRNDVAGGRLDAKRFSWIYMERWDATLDGRGADRPEELRAGAERRVCIQNTDCGASLLIYNR